MITNPTWLAEWRKHSKPSVVPLSKVETPVTSCYPLIGDRKSQIADFTVIKLHALGRDINEFSVGWIDGKKTSILIHFPRAVTIVDIYAGFTVRFLTRVSRNLANPRSF